MNGQIQLLEKKNAHIRDSRIKFYEDNHIYEIDGFTPEELISVTTLNKKIFADDFIPDEVLKKMRKNKKMEDPTNKYYQKTDEEIKELWEKNGKEASSLGTKMHQDIEYYYNNIPYENDSEEFGFFRKFLEDFPELEAYRTEWVIFDEELKIAGTIDMLFYNKNKNEFEIYDWKRVKEISFEEYNSKKSNDVKSEYDINLPNTNFWHYAMQLNIYKYILKKKYNLETTKMCLIVMHPDNVYKTYLRYELPDLQDKVEELMNWRLSFLQRKETQYSKTNIQEWFVRREIFQEERAAAGLSPAKPNGKNIQQWFQSETTTTWFHNQ